MFPKRDFFLGVQLNACEVWRMIFLMHQEKGGEDKKKDSMSPSILWRPPELNWAHTDFQSVALPTELGRRLKFCVPKDNIFRENVK